MCTCHLNNYNHSCVWYAFGITCSRSSICNSYTTVARDLWLKTILSPRAQPEGKGGFSHKSHGYRGITIFFIGGRKDCYKFARAVLLALTISCLLCDSLIGWKLVTRARWQQSVISLACSKHRAHRQWRIQLLIAALACVSGLDIQELELVLANHLYTERPRPPSRTGVSEPPTECPRPYPSQTGISEPPTKCPRPYPSRTGVSELPTERPRPYPSRTGVSELPTERPRLYLSSSHTMHNHYQQLKHKHTVTYAFHEHHSSWTGWTLCWLLVYMHCVIQSPCSKCLLVNFYYNEHDKGV